MSEAEIDQNLAESFPASDPPSWTVGTDHKGELPDSEKENFAGEIMSSTTSRFRAIGVFAAVCAVTAFCVVNLSRAIKKSSADIITDALNF